MAITFTVQNDLGTEAAANAYPTLAEFKAYCDNRLKDYATLSGNDDNKILAAIISATDYMDSRWDYAGYKVEENQSTQWPRNNVYNARGNNVVGVPLIVKRACIEYAFRALSADLFSDPDRDSTGQTIKSKEEKIGPITDKVTYSDAATIASPVYPVPDRMLKAEGLIADLGGGGIASTKMALS